MNERELRKLESVIRQRMKDIAEQRMSPKDSGIGGLLNNLKIADPALYENLLAEYKRLLARRTTIKAN